MEMYRIILIILVMTLWYQLNDFPYIINKQTHQILRIKDFKPIKTDYGCVRLKKKEIYDLNGINVAKDHIVRVPVVDIVKNLQSFRPYHDYKTVRFEI